MNPSSYNIDGDELYKTFFKTYIEEVPAPWFIETLTRNLYKYAGYIDTISKNEETIILQNILVNMKSKSNIDKGLTKLLKFQDDRKKNTQKAIMLTEYDKGLLQNDIKNIKKDILTISKYYLRRRLVAIIVVILIIVLFVVFINIYYSFCDGSVKSSYYAT